MQKFPAPQFSAEVTLEVPDSAPAGQVSGLIVFGYDYGWVGLRRTAAGGVELVHVPCPAAHKNGVERVTATATWPTQRAVTLRVTVSVGLKCRFAYRDAEESGAEFVELGEPFTASSSKWVGAKVGLFCASPAGPENGASGHAEFSGFLVGR